MGFYNFNQNNSGGGFITDKGRGIAEIVIVEAESTDAANKRAESIGLYFDGAGDCPCCGNRWREQWGGEEADDVPSVYGKPVTEVKAGFFNKSAYVHYIDGRVEHVELKK